jgi:ParB-like chromosome segregation protein Spo0J
MTTKDVPGGAVPAEVEVHPLADVFPLIEGSEFEELVDDIRRNGLRTPILLDAEGRLLDGRNRLRACRAAGVEPQFETWTGTGSVAKLIISLNLRRRHLSESQRAMMAARMVEESRKTMKIRWLAGESANWQTGTTVEEAALEFKVSPRSVARAARLRARGDEKVIRAVELGKAKVSASSERKRERPVKLSQEKLSAEEALRMLWEPACRLAEAVREVERRGGGEW